MVTGRMGRARRPDDAPEGVRRIVPLAGGRTVPAPPTGRIETLDDGLAGAIGSYDFAAVGNAHRTQDSHPGRHTKTRSPAGVPIRMGSIRRVRSERAGAERLSLAFHSPTAPSTGRTCRTARGRPRASTTSWR